MAFCEDLQKLRYLYDEVSKSVVPICVGKYDIGGRVTAGYSDFAFSYTGYSGIEAQLNSLHDSLWNDTAPGPAKQLEKYLKAFTYYLSIVVSGQSVPGTLAKAKQALAGIDASLADTESFVEPAAVNYDDFHKKFSASRSKLGFVIRGVQGIIDTAQIAGEDKQCVNKYHADLMSINRDILSVSYFASDLSMYIRAIVRDLENLMTIYTSINDLFSDGSYSDAQKELKVFSDTLASFSTDTDNMKSCGDIIGTPPESISE